MERDSSPSEQSPAKPRSWKKIAALCAAASGALGHLIIYILSRCVEVPVPFVHYDETGQKWHTWSSGHTGRSYKFFIQEYDLEVLTVLFWLLLLGGLSYAFLLPKVKKWRSAL